jgi:type II secretory pathway pseudopilin PulG
MSSWANVAQIRWTRVVLIAITIFLALVLASMLVRSPPPGWHGEAAEAIQRMNSLAAALDAYREVFGAYPPSNNKSDHNAPQYGAQCLFYYLMGPSGKGWSPSTIPAVEAKYNWPGVKNVNSDWVTTPKGYGGRPYFIDGISGGDRAILYYRAASEDSNGRPLVSSTQSVGLYNYYDFNDNCDATATAKSNSPFWPGRGLSPVSQWSTVAFTKQQQWENEITDFTRTGAALSNSEENITAIPAARRFPKNCNTYILISAGMDREFGLPSDPSRGWASDDITNYTP